MVGCDRWCGMVTGSSAFRVEEPGSNPGLPTPAVGSLGTLNLEHRIAKTLVRPWLVPGGISEGFFLAVPFTARRTKIADRLKLRVHQRHRWNRERAQVEQDLLAAQLDRQALDFFAPIPLSKERRH